MTTKQRAELYAKIWDPARPKLKTTMDRENRLAAKRGEKVPLTPQQILNRARRAERERRAMEAAR